MGAPRVHEREGGAAFGRSEARRWIGRLAPALVGLAAFAGIASVLDPGLRLERPGALRPQEKAEIRATIERYQKIYEDFFASGGAPAMLDDFPASKLVKHMIFRDIGFVRDAGMIFVQDLATSSFISVTRKGRDLAEADVYEEWNHVLESGMDRKPLTEVKGLGQGFRYVLRREGGEWRVVEWEIVDLPAPSREQGFKW